MLNFHVEFKMRPSFYTNYHPINQKLENRSLCFLIQISIFCSFWFAINQLDCCDNPFDFDKQIKMNKLIQI